MDILYEYYDNIYTKINNNEIVNKFEIKYIEETQENDEIYVILIKLIRFLLKSVNTEITKEQIRTLKYLLPHLVILKKIVLL